MIDSDRILVEAGLLPEEMPNNYTFNKVRKILSELSGADGSETRWRRNALDWLATERCE